MALLSERQQTAAALAREIQGLGGWVVSPMPLDDWAKLRFQVLDSNRQQVLEKLSSWDWSPTWCNNMPRVTSGGMQLASVYEIDLPLPRQPVAADYKTISGELASSAPKSDYEVEQVMRYLGWPPSQKRR
jgi:hypothetical protein